LKVIHGGIIVIVTEIAMGLPVFFPEPEINLTLPAGKRTTLKGLCVLAGVECRVTGLGAERTIFMASSQRMQIVRRPGALSDIWLGVPPGTTKRRSLLALGMLAYGIFDYGARETLRGLPESRATLGAGRPRSPRALTNVERQRRYRIRRSGSSDQRFREMRVTKEAKS